MDTSFEQQVRERAYEIWVAAGMTDGRATEHWLSAQQALLSEGGTEETTIRKAKLTKARGAATSASRPQASKPKTAKTKAPGSKTRAA